MPRARELRLRNAVANWYEATLMHPVTADPRISGVPYSPIALRTGVDWPERRTVQEPTTDDACVCGAKHNDDRAAAQRRCATRVLWMMMQHGVQ